MRKAAGVFRGFIEIVFSWGVCVIKQPLPVYAVKKKAVKIG